MERRDAWELATHGARAGLLAGLALGLIEILASAVLRGDPWLPFDFAAAIVVGPEALSPGFPVAASVILGIVIHVLLSMVFGVAFLTALALMFQLSARPWLILLYGLLFGVTVWEVDFLAVLPVIAPALSGQLDLALVDLRQAAPGGPRHVEPGQGVQRFLIGVVEVQHRAPGRHRSIAQPPRSLERARRMLQTAGFSWKPDGTLVDGRGDAVEFSMVTNAGNTERAQMATIIQDDLKQLGMRVQIRTGKSKSKGRLIIHYASLDQFDQLLEKLGVATAES